MVKFLLQRPIAVFMAFTALFIVGLVTYNNVPISLLPDIAIPEITVQVNGENMSARELENTTVRPIRQQLMQVGQMRDIESETRDGSAIIRLKFDFGTNTDLAFIEVNEKIDAAMGGLPKSVMRPRVIKASATDIPVFYVNMTLKEDSAYGETNKKRFLELSEFAETVIKRSIERLSEVAMVDVTGIMSEQVQITPDLVKLEIAGLTLQDIENILNENNIEPGSMVVRDGYYEYNIKFSTLLRTVDDIRDIYIKKNDRIFQLKDLADVELVPQKENGYSLSQGKQAITLAIIKQSEENMDKMKAALNNEMNYFRYVYPDIEFTITQNQTELLDYTISNLKQNLSLGFFLICLVAVLFLGDVKSPFIIGLSMVVSLVVSFLFFYLFNMTFNVISLSGLILALGMMIDNSIIVTENITQYRDAGYTLDEACNKGTTEVITPMLSSSFTTIAVFVPLIFMSGIAGAIFYDQAFSVTVGLLVSYFTGIMLLPVLYKLIYGVNISKWKIFKIKIHNPIKAHTLDRFYDAGVDFVFNHKKSSVIFVILSFPLCFWMFYEIRKERMPEIDQTELLVNIEWNENIHIGENRKRVCQLFEQTSTENPQHTAYIGLQQFLLNRDKEFSSSEAGLYFKVSEPAAVARLQKEVEEWMQKHYPKAIATFLPPETIFEKIFVTGEPEIKVELYVSKRDNTPDLQKLRDMRISMHQITGEAASEIPFEDQLNVSIDWEKLKLYNVSYYEVTKILKTAFKENRVALLRSYQQYLPITLAGDKMTVNKILEETIVKTNPDKEGKVYSIPLQSLIKIVPSEDLKIITSGKNGEFVPFDFYEVAKPEKLISEVKKEVSKDKDWEVDFSGSFFSSREMLDELVVILLVSLLLMYFILAAQFESFSQPLIVLLEIPIDVAFGLFLLWICGHTLNLMSAIGIVVTCGIVINDSILKLDAINELRKEGMPLIQAIHEAGRRRLRPIIMTSLTTILAMVPLLFSFDMGSELQKPLSIAMIGAMVIGTLVSLFIIPLVYWFLYRHQETSKC